MKNEIIKIITDLRKFSDRVDEITGEVAYDTIKHCVAKLKQALYDNPNIAALCAPQIGENLRLFVVKTAKNEDRRFKVFLNPIIVKSDGMHLSREISASFPNKEFIIPRRDSVHVAFQGEDGMVNSETYIGAYAEIVQQMIEMLDGITLDNYGLDLDDVGGAIEFDKASNENKVKLISLYLDQVKNLAKKHAEEIKNSPELNTINKSIDFAAGILAGTITPVDLKAETKGEAIDKVADKASVEKGN